MSRTYYDPNEQPEPGQWLLLDPTERTRLVKNYLVSAKVKSRFKPKVFALFIAAAENMLASGHGPSMRAVRRLTEEGCSRAQAIEVIAFTLVACPVGSMGFAADVSAREQQLRLNNALDALTRENFKESKSDAV